jgi:hypothetical protein
MKNKYLPVKFLLYTALVLFVLLICYVLYSNIFYPAKLSVQRGCMDISEEDMIEKGYYTSGSFTVNISVERPGEVETNITIINEEDGLTMKHELIHAHQYAEGRLDGCDNRIGKYRDELEAYTFMYLPDKMFYRIYRNI